jgi:hypothetical protein
MLELGVSFARATPAVLFVGLVGLGLVLPGQLLGQRSAAPDSLPPASGIGASGALGFLVGAAELQRAGGSQFVGVALDLGRLANPRTRFQIEATLLRGTLHEFVELEDQTYSGPIYDLTGSLEAVQLLRPPSRRVQPYVSGALSVHAMSSAFNSTILDRRYNTNNFGAHAAFGLRIRLGRAGQNALALEVRRTTVREMNRVSFTIGLLQLMRELAPPLAR